MINVLKNVQMVIIQIVNNVFSVIQCVAHVQVKADFHLFRRNEYLFVLKEDQKMIVNHVQMVLFLMKNKRNV
jgi:hypothetical protein